MLSLKENKSLSVNYSGDMNQFCHDNSVEILALITNKVFKQCDKYNLLEEDFKDIVNESYLFLLTRINQYNPEISKVSTFIETVLDGHIFNQVKKIRRYKKNKYKYSRFASRKKYKEEYISYSELPVFHGIHSEIQELLSKGLTKGQVRISLGLSEDAMTKNIKQMKELIEYRKQCSKS